MNIQNFLSKEERSQIIKAISKAEEVCSCEVRLHLENNFIGDVLNRAAYVFEKLEMHKTKHRNGILIYIAVQKRNFAFIGDVGVNQVVADDFWTKHREHLLDGLGKSKFATTIQELILNIGDELKRYFPPEENDENEISDEITTNEDIE